MAAQAKTPAPTPLATAVKTAKKAAKAARKTVTDAFVPGGLRTELPAGSKKVGVGGSDKQFRELAFNNAADDAHTSVFRFYSGVIDV
jgi:hypothetical protein